MEIIHQGWCCKLFFSNWFTWRQIGWLAQSHNLGTQLAPSLLFILFLYYYIINTYIQTAIQSVSIHYLSAYANQTRLRPREAEAEAEAAAAAEHNRRDRNLQVVPTTKIPRGSSTRSSSLNSSSVPRLNATNRFEIYNIFLARFSLRCLRISNTSLLELAPFVNIV